MTAGLPSSHLVTRLVTLQPHTAFLGCIVFIRKQYKNPGVWLHEHSALGRAALGPGRSRESGDQASGPGWLCALHHPGSTAGSSYVDEVVEVIISPF